MSVCFVRNGEESRESRVKCVHGMTDLPRIRKRWASCRIQHQSRGEGHAGMAMQNGDDTGELGEGRDVQAGESGVSGPLVVTLCEGL